ncbi:WD40-repeat-containing domain protein [Schizophyllum commune]
MADEGVNMKLQQSLDALPVEEREAVTAVWSQFSSSSHARRAIILQGLLTLCCFSQLSLLADSLQHLIRIDPFAVLPREIGLKILGYLDATSLCRAAQVSRRWKALADDDILWRGICEQHIGQKCHKCGWGLPLLDKKRLYRAQSVTPVPGASDPVSSPHGCTLSVKRPREDSPDLEEQPPKRQRSSSPSQDNHRHEESAAESSRRASLSLIAPTSPDRLSPSSTRPWKEVYSERMTVEWNWRRGRCTVRTLEGHTDGVMCLQFNENLTHPAFPVLITGSYDRTARVWNLETGLELHVLRGHTRAIRALQFDEYKLITGSMDCSLKVWDWRRGTCIRTLFGHTEGVVCLNFDSNILASGSVDSTIKVWNLRTGCAFTLRGHRDWVNSVQLWDRTAGGAAGPAAPTVFDGPPCNGSSGGADPGKMLFSASDDGSIRLWDLHLRTCVRQFTGHIGQVQSIKLMFTPDCGDGDGSDAEEGPTGRSSPAPRTKLPTLVSGSLDNTIKVWDVETGACVRTHFGHIGGVWAVAADKMRIVSGSHDRTIKVWSPDNGSNIATLAGHEASVSCIALGEDKIVSGGDDKTIKVWSFAG